MNNYELNKLKRSVVAKAWLAEKLRISKGEATRDWPAVDQNSILKYNIASGYVAQFLDDSMDENNMKVQFVETSIEYFASHDVRHARRKTGVIDTENFIVTPSSVLPVIKLSESLYSGYFDSHRHLFVGQDIGFGLKVTVPKSNQQADVNSYKNKLRLENPKESTDSATTDTAQQRMKKYGF